MRKFRLSSIFRISERPPLVPDDLTSEPQGDLLPDHCKQHEANHAEQTGKLCGDIDQALLSLSNARSDVDGLASVLARLENEAARVPALSEENRDLSRKLRKLEADFAALKVEETTSKRELASARAALTRAEQRVSELERQRQDLLRMNADARERVVSLGETIVRSKREVEIAEAARSKCEAEMSGLRMALAERERTIENTRSELSKLRFASVQHEDRIARLSEEKDETSQRLELLTHENLVVRRDKDQLAEDIKALRDSHERSESLQKDQRISLDARISSLDEALIQERHGHEVTKHLLDEERRVSRLLAEESRVQKQKMVSMAQDYEQIKAELLSYQSAMRDHSIRLCETNKSLAAALEEKDQIQTLLSQTQGENREMIDRVAKLECAEMEIGQLRQKILSLSDGVTELRRAAKDEGTMGTPVNSDLLPASRPKAEIRMHS